LDLLVKGGVEVDGEVRDVLDQVLPVLPSAIRTAGPLLDLQATATMCVSLGNMSMVY
jgi:hypothetical protein